MSDFRIGPAGISGKGYEQGLKEASERGFTALEVAFTHGAHMDNERAEEVGRIATELGIKLSIHAPYYINLVSKEKEKIEASKKRILRSAERARHMGAEFVVFHAGYYQGRGKEEIYDSIKEEILDLQKTIEEKGWDVKLAPETTGKPTQFGDVDELLKLSKETGCFYCVDFAHLLARNNGKVDFEEVVKKLPDNLHCHYSGIEYGEKGEKNHLPVDVDDFKNIIPLLRKHGKNAVIICEAPDTFADAEKMLKAL